MAQKGPSQHINAREPFAYENWAMIILLVREVYGRQLLQRLTLREAVKNVLADFAR